MESELKRFYRELIHEVHGKTASQLVENEKMTSDSRLHNVFLSCAKSNFSGIERQIFDNMWLGNNLEELNDQLYVILENDLRELSKYKSDTSISLANDLYSLWYNIRLISFYFCFGKKSTYMPGRLGKKVESILLELLWERTKYKNDIAVTKQNTWWMSGSENHDLNTKVCNLLSSLIFMQEDDYKDKIYPDLGFGDGTGYGGKVGYGRSEKTRFGGGRADLKDSKEYKAYEHYLAWIEYFHRYFTDRARRGFFLENASPGYMKYTISYILAIHNFCKDENLKTKTVMFLDLFWADWAQQQLDGLYGGPRVRHHFSLEGYDAISEMARFYLGGPGNTFYNYVQVLLGDYRWPAIVWDIFLNKKENGSYECISRGIGEEENLFPRPSGVERTMMGNVQSRFVKYCWVTPEYILGTQMDHPNAFYNHIALSLRSQGLITPYPEKRIIIIS